MNIKDTSDSIIVDVEHVSKVFCRNLKRGMWYGVRDLGIELIGRGKDRQPDQLRKGEFYAIKDASFQVRRGECLAMMGPNGAGKSTMLKMINGLIRPSSGTIRIRGKIGALIELGTGFNPILSGRENVYINASILGMQRRQVDQLFDEIVAFAELQDVINDPVKTYSSGMKVRLGYSVAANLRPDLLIMDEVLAVGDVGFRVKCFAHLKGLIEQGVAIILVSHSVSMLQRVATRGIVFGHGAVVHDGDLQSAGTMYEELVNVTSQSADLEQDPLRNEDGTITAVTTLNAAGEPQTDFETGDALTLQVQLECRSAIPNARVIVAVASPSFGVIAAVSSVYQGLVMQLRPGTNVVRLHFKSLPLLVGSYSFNVSLYGPETDDFYHRLLAQSPIRIVGPPINTDGRGIRGLIKLEHRWQVE